MKQKDSGGTNLLPSVNRKSFHFVSIFVKKELEKEKTGCCCMG